jgi:DNA-binding GntR family transcriptional regulator
MAELLYQQIADDLRQQIESGQLPAGSQLGTEVELREYHGASRNTVRDAIKSLITRGLIETRPGQGTFATETIVPFVTPRTGDRETASGGEGKTYSQEVAVTLRMPKDTNPEVGIRPAYADIAADLQISESDQVLSRHQRRPSYGAARSLQPSFYSRCFINEGGAHRLLEARNIAERRECHA